ncbi:copper resistance protein CopC [Streptomyces daliensis]|uniref:Copper resistance protein CopC n=1 Tax=Streptomyces daliensis TaxID=299421 RepID=A0A8T4IPB8_9ACTN|nr:copper resistance protein CopC [Streptomyces daliensis]
MPAVLLTLLLGVLLSLPVALGTATPASAHAALTGSSPAEGSVVDSAPEEVTLSFSEGVAMSDGSIRVLDPRGKRVDEGTVRDLGGADDAGGGSGGSTVKRGVGLKSGLPDGTFTVAWQAVSADSHPVSGAFTFSIGAPSETTAAVPEQNADAGGGTVGVLYGIGRYAAYAGFVLLIGGAAFVLACWPRGATVRPVQRLVLTGWVTLTAATLLMLFLRTPYTGSGELADALDLGGLRDAVGTKPGAALVSRLLLLGASALFVSVLFGAYARDRDSSSRRDLVFGLGLGGTVVAAGLGATWAMAEHASTGIQTGLAMPVDVVHLLAVATWLGGLAALLVSLYWGPPIERAAVLRFSRLAFWSVTVLAATGLYQSWRQVGSWSALTGTSYGQLLIVKVGLVALLVGIAWISRRWTARLGETAEATETDADPAERERERPEPAAVGKGAAETSTRTSGTPGEGTGAGSGAGAGTGTSENPGEATGTGHGEPADPKRAAQLARQRTAMDAARRKKTRDADPVRAGLRRSVLVEAGIAVVLLAVTTVLTGTEPGRTEEAARAAGNGSAGAPAERGGPVELDVPFDTGGEHGKGTASLQLDPGRTGDNTLHLLTTDPEGTPLSVPEVKVALTLPAKDIGPIPVTLEPVAGENGHWAATGVQLPMAGRWKVAVTVRTSDIDQVTENRTVRVG